MAYLNSLPKLWYWIIVLIVALLLAALVGILCEALDVSLGWWLGPIRFSVGEGDAT